MRFFPLVIVFFTLLSGSAQAQRLDATDLLRGIMTIQTEVERQRQRDEAQRQQQIQQQQIRQRQQQVRTPQQPQHSQAQRAAEAAERARVREIQALLNGLGYDAGPADGLPGPRTRAALEAFQRDNNLPPSGGLDEAALGMLRFAASGAEPAAPAASGPDAPADESGRATVAEVQRLLNELGYGAGAVDGVAGGQTAAALAAFARDHGIAEPLAPDPAALGALRLAVARGGNALGRTAAEGAAAEVSAAQHEPRALDAETAHAHAAPEAGGEAPLAGPPATIGAAPAGLRPLAYLTVDGIPVLNQPERGRNPADLLDLLAMALRPERLETEALAYAGRFLDAEARARFVVSLGGGRASFAGATEFGREATRQAFLDEFGPKLIAWAPEVPMTVAIQHDILILPSWDLYDDARGGLDLGRVDRDALSRAPRLPGAERIVYETEAPDLLWRMGEPEAERLLERLMAEQHPARGAGPVALRLVVFVDIVAADAASGTLTARQRHTDIYDRDLGVVLGSLPAPRAMGAVAEGAPGDIARFASPPPGIRPIAVSAGEDGLVLDFARDNLGVSPGALFLSAMRHAADPEAIVARAWDFAHLHLGQGVINRYSDGGRHTWLGRDEFEREDARERFEAEIVAPFVAWAPKPPKRIVMPFPARLGEYDAGRGRLPFANPDRILAFGTANTSLVIRNAPDLAAGIPADRDAARALLERLRAAGGAADRAVSIRLVLDLDGAAGGAIQARAVSAAVMDPAGRETIHVLDLPTSGFGAFAEREIPPVLEFAALPDFGHRLNIHAWALKAGATGFEPRALENMVYWSDRHSGAFHHATPDTSGWSAADHRWPFAGRTGTRIRSVRDEDPDPELGRFRAYMQAYAAGLPDAARLEQPLEAGDRRGLLDALGHRSARSDVANRLAAKLGVFPDQIREVPGGDTSSRYPLYLVTPGRGDAYAVSRETFLPAGALPEELRAVTEIRIDGVERIEDEGAPALVFRIAPERVRLHGGGAVLASYALDAAPAVQEDEPAAIGAGGPVPLEPALVDLLAAATLGERLSDEALAHLGVRRWMIEREAEDPLGGRHLPPGAPPPASGAEAVEAGRAFVAWARERPVALPLRVVRTAGSVVWQEPDGHLRDNRSAMDQIFGARLRETFEIERAAGRCRRQIDDMLRSAERGGAPASPDAVRRCAGLEALSALRDLQRTGPSASSQMDRNRAFRAASQRNPVTFPDPLTVVYRHLEGVPVPVIEVLGGLGRWGQQMDVEVTFDLVAVSGGEAAALPALLDDDLRDFVEANVGDLRQLLGAETADRLVLDLALVEGVWTDGEGNRHVVGADGGTSAAALAEALRDTAAALDAAEKAKPAAEATLSVAVATAAVPDTADPVPDPFGPVPDSAAAAADPAPAAPAVSPPSEPEGAADVALPELDSGPFDVVGIRLGMDFDAADAAIRGHMAVERVLETDPARQLPHLPGELAAFTSGRMYVAHGGADIVAIFDEPPALPERVAGAWRLLRLPEGTLTADAVHATAAARYGAPASNVPSPRMSGAVGHDLVWTEDGSVGESCFQQVFGGRPTIWRENGALPILGAPYILPQGLPVLAPPELFQASLMATLGGRAGELFCGLHFGIAFTDYAGQPNQPPETAQEIVTWLADLRAYHAILSASRQAPRLSPQPAHFDFLSAGSGAPGAAEDGEDAD